MIEFRGIDIVLDRSPGKDRIRDSIAVVLSVEPARVAVVHDMRHYPEQRTADVVCVVTPTSGDFAEVVSIQCESMKLGFGHALEVVSQLSSILPARILAPDDSPDPYRMWLVEPSRTPVRVALNETALDAERYEIL